MGEKTMSSENAAAETPKLWIWMGRVIWGLFVAFMVMDVGMKLVQHPMVEITGQQLGLPRGEGLTIGIIEAICLVLYVIPRTSVLGAVLFMGVLGGAVQTHIRVGSPLASHILFGVYMGVIMWGGLWLRDPKLRAVFPIRR